MNKQEKQLLEAFRKLPKEAQLNLLDYADFLCIRYPAAEPVQERQDIPRPAQETVIAAVKRLSQTYPMLNKDKLLHETSGLVSEHLLQGREAAAVIDDLENMFRRHYAELKSHTE